jgi:hypothetical protein
MNYEQKLIKSINPDEIDFNNPEFTKELIKSFLNIIESLNHEIKDLKIQNQELRNEINKLKGEKGKPDIKPSKKDDDRPNTGGNMESGTRKNWSKSSKTNKIKIDRVIKIKIDKGTLPSDVTFKGYESKVIQDIEIKTNNTLYKLEKYYSPSEKKTYIAEVPEEHQDTEFGINLKALSSMLYFGYRVPENKIVKFLSEFEIKISEGTISNFLIKGYAAKLKKEKDCVFEAGLKSSSYQQIDDTAIRVNGVNNHVSIVCNERYSAYFINPYKNRETVGKIIYNNGDIAVFDVLVSDDAPQFEDLTEKRALCWVHEERHYKKMTPFLDYHKDLVQEFRGKMWDFYKKLKEYKENPNEEKKKELNMGFDNLFSTETGYVDLDERIALTRKKKKDLLVVLENPEVPLHNNLSENGLREIVIKRKISGGTKTIEGSNAWENYMTIMESCKKQSVNFLNYIKDLFRGKKETSKLAEFISGSVC